MTSQTVQIPLYAGNGDIIAHALIDAIDEAWLSQWKWSLIKHGTGYAGRQHSVAGRNIMTYMHREILGLTPCLKKIVTDHINHDTLDNCRANLRAVTQGQNLQNKRASRNATSPYRGVHWHKHKQVWEAQAKLHGKHYWIGQFRSEAEAAQAASQWRACHMPFAVETIQEHFKRRQSWTAKLPPLAQREPLRRQQARRQ